MLSRAFARMSGSWFAAALSVALVGVWPAASAAEDPLAGLDAAVESARAQWQAPGLAVAIVKDDKVVFAKGYGVKRLGENSPVDTHTLFTLASTSKAFVGVALGMLVDEGKVRWDDPVIRYLPEFRVADPYVTREVTIRDLLVHRTGIEEMDILWTRGFDTTTSLKQIQNARQASSLRSAWAYNNMMYVVAAEVVARVSGKTFQDFVTQRIFTPLGMKDSTFTSALLAQNSNAVGAHLMEQGKPRSIEPYRSPNPLGASGVQSSAADMAQWIRMLLNRGSFAGGSILKPETFAETIKPQMLLANIGYPAAVEAKPHFYAYGLGWFVQDYKGRLLAMHTGSLYGANALVAIMPEEHLGLVILINAGAVEYRHAFMYDVIDRFLGSRDRDWNADLFKIAEKLQARENEQRTKALKARPANAKPSLPLTEYAGSYTNPVAGEVQVVVKEAGKLALVMQPSGNFTLTHWSFDAFEASDDRAPEERFLITFQRGADGKVSGYNSAENRTYVRAR